MGTNISWDLFTAPSTTDVLGEEGFKSFPLAWLLPVAVIRLNVGGQHAETWESMTIGDPNKSH